MVTLSSGLSSQGLKLTNHLQYSVEIKNKWSYRAYVHFYVLTVSGISESALFPLLRSAYSVGGNGSDATTLEFCYLWQAGNNQQYAILTFNTGWKPIDNKTKPTGLVCLYQLLRRSDRSEYCDPCSNVAHSKVK